MWAKFLYTRRHDEDEHATMVRGGYQEAGWMGGLEKDTGRLR